MSSDSPIDRLEAWLEQPDRLAGATRALQRIAIAIVGDAATAEDIVQGAWLESLKDSNRDKGMGWMRRLVRHRSIDSYRRRLRAPEPLSGQSQEGPADGSHDHTAQLALQRELIEAVEALREPYRGVLFMRYFEGMGPAAIAQRQGASVHTIKSQLQRGLDQLRRKLAPNHHQGERWSPALLAFAGTDGVRLAAPASGASVLAPTVLIAMKTLWIPAVLFLALFGGWWAFSSDGDAAKGALSQAVEERTSHSELAGHAESGGSNGSTKEREVLPKSVQATEPAATAASTGSLQVQVLDQAGGPVAGVHVIASAVVELPQYRALYRARSNAQGWAVLEDMPAGAYTLRTDRHRPKPNVEVQIEPGAELSRTLTLLRGVRVTGQVVDEAGRPVTDAQVWMTSNSSGWTRGGVVGRSDGKGNFTILDAPKDQSIGALAAGFAPSQLVDLDLHDTSGGSAELVLKLVRGGAAVSGQVRDAAGRPLPGVLVAVGDTRRYGDMRPDGTFAENWSPLSAQTDAQGRYHLVGLEAGKHRVQMRAAGWARWSGSFEVETGQVARVDATMVPGLTLRGVVTGGDGQPVAGARILALREPITESYLQGGQVDYYGAFGAVGRLTDSQGRYSMDRVAPGETILYALEPKPEGYVPFEDIAFVKEHRVLRGESEEWNPVITDGQVIEGRLMYNDGAPIEGMFIILTGQKGEGHRVVPCESGEFRFKSLGAGPYNLRVQMWDVPPGKQEPSLAGIYPGGAPVELIADWPSPNVIDAAIVSVSLRDDGQRLEGSNDKPRILLEGDGHYQQVYGKPLAGGEGWEFRVEKPGAYRAVARLNKRIVATGPSFEIQGGETLRLPDLVTEPAGTLILKFEKDPSFELEDLWAQVSADSSPYGETLTVENRDQIQLTNLTAGPTSVLIRGNNVVEATHSVNVLAGQETTLSIPLRRAMPVTYRIHLTAEDRTGSMRVEIKDRKTGHIYDEFEREELGIYGEHFRWRVFLPLGEYTITVTKSDQPAQSKDFELTSFDAGGLPVLEFD